MSAGVGGPAAHGHGPFHRLASPTQDFAAAQRQLASGQIWGRVARGGHSPSVKAYRGPLPPAAEGIEFVTDVAPSPGSHPNLVFWYSGDPGVTTMRQSGDEFAVIAAVITRCVYGNQQVRHVHTPQP